MININHQNSDNDSPLCQLPLDAIDIILFYLDYNSLVSISETCKFFYYYSTDDKYWKYFNDHQFFKQFRIPISYIVESDDENTEITTNNNNSDNIISIPKIKLEKKGRVERKFFTTRMKAANNWENGNFFCGAIETSAKYVFMQINDMNPNQVTTSNLNELTEWDINTGEIISCFQIPNKCHYFNMRYNRIAVSGDDAVRVYDKESKSFLYEVEGLLSQAHRTEIIENYLVLGFWDGDINVHNLQNGAFINKISGHNKPVHALSCHLGDGFISRSMVASGSSDKSVKVFDMFKTTKEDQFVAHLRGHSMTINAIQFTSGGRQLLSASKDTTIKLWDLETCVCLDILSKHTDSVNALRAESGWVVSGSSDKTVRIWDLRTPSKLIHTLTGHESPVSCLDVDEGKIVSLDDTRILLWRFDYF